MSLDREMGEKLGNFLLAHFVGVALAVKEDVAPDPIDVGFFGANTVMFHPQMPVHAIEQFGRGGDGSSGWRHESRSFQSGRRRASVATRATLC